MNKWLLKLIFLALFSALVLSFWFSYFDIWPMIFLVLLDGALDGLAEAVSAKVIAHNSRERKRVALCFSLFVMALLSIGAVIIKSIRWADFPGGFLLLALILSLMKLWRYRKDGKNG